MSKSAKSNGIRKAAEPGQLWLRLPGLVREALYETVIGAGLACVDEVLEAEWTGPNLIENLFSRVREIGRRVRRWQSGTMVLRWTAAGVLEAERGFRKLVGYRAMPIWVAALRARDVQLDGDRQGVVDAAEKAA